MSITESQSQITPVTPAVRRSHVPEALVTLVTLRVQRVRVREGGTELLGKVWQRMRRAMMSAGWNCDQGVSGGTLLLPWLEQSATELRSRRAATSVYQYISTVCYTLQVAMQCRMACGRRMM